MWGIGKECLEACFSFFRCFYSTQRKKTKKRKNGNMRKKRPSSPCRSQPWMKTWLPWRKSGKAVKDEWVSWRNRQMIYVGTMLSWKQQSRIIRMREEHCWRGKLWSWWWGSMVWEIKWTEGENLFELFWDSVFMLYLNLYLFLVPGLWVQFLQSATVCHPCQSTARAFGNQLCSLWLLCRKQGRLIRILSPNPQLCACSQRFFVHL